MKRMNYKYLLATEYQTEQYSRAYLKGFDDNSAKMIDALLQITYFYGVHKNVSTAEGLFHAYCFNQYLQTPYSFRACLVLYEKGLYMEACFILRHLFEILVKMKYLKNHKELTEKFWSGKTIEILTLKGKKRRLLIKDMFEEVSPGYYENNYGRFLSNIQHSGIGAVFFRTEGKDIKKRELRQGSKWDEFQATYIVNNFTAIAYCYLRNFQVFFPEGFKTFDTKFSAQYIEIMIWLEGAIDAHKKTKPKSEKWYQEMSGLMSI
jgi:hypothetical protein